MAQAAPQFEEEDKPGNVDSAPPGRAQLKGLEGGGETSEPNGSWYKPKGSEQDAASSEEEAGLEQAGGQSEGQPEHENQVGAGYTKSGLRQTVPMSRKEKSDARKWRFMNRRRALFGGGIIGTLIAILVFFISSGPLEFVHIAQLLEQFHSSASQDQSDDRFTKLARYIRYQSQGKVQNVRLGKFQNAMADKIEAKLNATGIESSYNGPFHFQDGYIIDPAKLSTTEFEDLKGKTPTEIEQYFRDNFDGLQVSTTDPSTGKPFTDGRVFWDNTKVKVGFFNTNGRAFMKTFMKASGYSKITGSAAFRIMAKRGAVPLHPISAAEGKGLTKAAQLIEWAKDRFSTVDKGTPLPETASNNVDAKKNPAGATTAQGQVDGANSTISDGQSAYANLKAGAKDAFAQAKAGLQSKFTIGGLVATGVFCTLKGLDSHSAQIKEAQIALPLAREGGEAVAVGGQVMSGQDLDTTHLGFYKNLLNGTDHTGQNSSWIQADSIQAELGHANTGVKPVKTLTTINGTSPFSFLNEGALGLALGGICSTPGVAAQIVIGFFGGGSLSSQLTQLAVTTIVGGQLLDDAAHWIAGTAVDPTAPGADYGNAINFGWRLANNGQEVSQGGRMLSANESHTLSAFEYNQAQKEFASHGLAYKLLNPYDVHSAMSKLIDQQSPNVSQDVSNTATAFLNFGHIFASIPKLFTASAHAATPAPYDYGFPQYGFSVDEMNDPAVNNPYVNADNVVNNILPSHPEYIDWAKKCFGVTIDPTSYDVSDFGTTAIDPTNPDPKQVNFYANTDQGSGCDTSVAYNSHSIKLAAAGAASTDCTIDTSDACNKLKVRFYINDTENATSAQCVLGDSNDPNTQQACSSIGFDESQNSSTTTTPTGTTPNGNAQQLAQQILSNHSISLSCRHCMEDIQNTVNGQPAYSNVHLDIGILQFLLDLATHGSVVVTSITGAGSGHSTGSNHYTGHAIDLGCVGVGTQVDLLNQIASKYNGKNNGERCDAPNPFGNPPHDHYDFFN